LIRKLLHKHDDRLMFAGIVVIAANSGGVWSPIGDVTTTMLWIGGQITSLAIIKSLLLPSLVSLLLPLGVMAFLLRGRPVVSPPADNGNGGHHATGFERNLMFFLGLAILVAVPAFKTLTNLPPFMGILLGLGVLWIVGDLLHRNKPDEEKQRLTLVHAITKIDMASIMFFVGILLSVATLEHAKILSSLASSLDRTVGRQDLIVLIIGIASAIVDNVPLVAAAMGMYSLTAFPTDHFMWAFLAYCSGTGGSILVIGSAAGVAAMGLEKITFAWYFKHVSSLALLGYLAGAGTYLVQHALTN
jgi:Na+/H+ antiporter NhaD/arsenite permease-like protein